MKREQRGVETDLHREELKQTYIGLTAYPSTLILTAKNTSKGKECNQPPVWSVKEYVDGTSSSESAPKASTDDDSVSSEAKREKAASSKDEKIQDFGEKIGGARKDLAIRDTEKGSALFARDGGRKSVLTDVEFDAVFQRATSRLKDADRVAQFVKVPSFESLPAAILKEADKQGNNGGISGVFHRGKVYLIRDAIASEKRLEEVIFHEWHSHAGI